MKSIDGDAITNKSIKKSKKRLYFTPRINH